MTEHEHKFVPLDGKYYRRGEDGWPNQSIAYQRLFCETCGETKEIVAWDHRSTARGVNEP